MSRLKFKDTHRDSELYGTRESSVKSVFKWFESFFWVRAFLSKLYSRRQMSIILQPPDNAEKRQASVGRAT